MKTFNQILDEEIEKCRIRHRTVKGGTIDVISIKDAKQVFALAEKQSSKNYLVKLEELNLFGILEELSNREKTILKMRFIGRLTLEEVAISFGVTRERIRQIEAKALEILRQHLRSRITN